MVDAPILVRLRDRDAAVVDAWRRHFRGVQAVEIGFGDIFAVAADAIVSPANSFGYMDGGIDAVYLERFGAGLQWRLQERLRERHGGELVVGEAVIVETGASELRWLVSAPTMRVPGPVKDTLNAYLAFRAALRAVLAHNEAGLPRIASVLCPGLASAIGAMPPERVARQMRFAYDVTLGGRPWPPLRAAEIHETHRELLR
ncbi:MAG: macro domain-containing protein [Myxococcales bacterium]|nr:macro domain-containing protein [Myxococcales bacterium]